MYMLEVGCIADVTRNYKTQGYRQDRSTTPKLEESISTTWKTYRQYIPIGEILEAVSLKLEIRQKYVLSLMQVRITLADLTMQ